MQQMVKSYNVSDIGCINNVCRKALGGVLVMVFVTSGVGSVASSYDCPSVKIVQTDSEYNYSEQLLTNQLTNFNNIIVKNYSSVENVDGCILDNNVKAELEAYNLFGPLRQLTQEEREAKRKSLAAISKPTGRNFSDFF